MFSNAALTLVASTLSVITDVPLAQPPAPPPPIVGMGQSGFFLGTVDSGFQLRLRGVIQADGHAFVDAPSGGPTDTFFIRRARPIIEGTVANLADFRLLPDFGQGKLVLYDAFLDVKLRPWLNLRAGKFKTPFGIERLQQEQSLLFIERGVPINLVPDRDVGVSLHGDLWGRTVNYELAVMNGVPDNASADFDADNHKDIVGRVFLRPLAATSSETWRDIGLGVAATAGAESGTLANGLLPTFVTGAQNAVFSYAPDAYAAGTHVRVSPQLSAYVKSFGLVAEVVTDAQAVRRGPVTSTLHHHAWQAEASYVLTGERASYSGLVPSHPLDPTDGGFGAYELAARFGELDVDPLTFPTFADPNKSAQGLHAWAVGLNAYLHRTVKLSLNYERSTFIAAPGAAAFRAPENALLGRLQVSF